MKFNLGDLSPPIFAISNAGWTLEGDDIPDLFTASPDDDLSGWKGMTIFDASGRKWRTTAIQIKSPKSKVGRVVGKVMHMCVTLDAEVELIEVSALADLKREVVERHGESFLNGVADDPKEIIKRL